MKVRLKLFFEWGIEFDKDNPYTVKENANRQVQYADRKEIMDAIVKKHHPEFLEEPPADSTVGAVSGGQSQTESQTHEPQVSPTRKTDKRKTTSGGGGTALRTTPPHKRTAMTEQESNPDESP